ncbi:hypothetical protein AM1_2678 [Acaryochloris marina MBIC11017]|uniref:Uncharacterized protein n=1 Tax=Acaryochloris marina (strain MBIC 11017) TaxID=329726 RepID=B0C7Z7_ACAM1|nr:hypothetical protein AM1_2678 [Acaryochloris marina MBIC11017]BDM82416.1 hypothetical protein AM10699_52770 [Acaryochloris marina MBIC10699]
MGVPKGVLGSVGEKGRRYLMIASIRGRNAIIQKRIDESFEVIKSLTQNDLLVKDEHETVY